MRRVRRKVMSATKLQSAWRRKMAYEAREMLLKENLAKEAACITLQSTWRGHATRKDVNRILSQKKAAEDQRHKAATQIQSRHRGRIGRREAERERAYIKEREAAANKIRKEWLEQKKQQEETEMNKSATVIQTRWRGKKGRENAERQKAALTIQRGIRTHNADILLSDAAKEKRGYLCGSYDGKGGNRGV